MRTVCAAESAYGAIHSPITNVAIASGMPARNSTTAARAGDSPAVRITVYSELLDRCARTYSVPISTATGINS